MAVQPSTALLWLLKTGSPICQGYGLSEASPAVTCNPVDNSPFSGHLGQPLPGTELLLIDDEDHAVAPGTPGEIAVRGPQVMAGYWQRPDETARVMTASGHLRTGDIGVFDDSGALRLIDRKKDLIFGSGTTRHHPAGCTGQPTWKRRNQRQRSAARTALMYPALAPALLGS